MEAQQATYQVDFSRYEKELMEAARLQGLKGTLGVEAPHAAIGGPLAEGVREEAARRRADLIITAVRRALWLIFIALILACAFIALILACAAFALPGVERLTPVNERMAQKLPDIA